jgi:DNA-binding MarR family transcriptional regulator
MSVGELAKYLMVSRQNLSGLLSRMERDGHIAMKADTLDRRSKLVSMTAIGRKVWQNDAQPKILSYYESALDGFSVSDLSHTLHYLLKLLENMKEIDLAAGTADLKD